MKKLFAYLLLSFPALPACGGNTLGVGSNDAGQVGPLGSNGPALDSAVCPSTTPAIGAACSADGAECEYGSRASASCNDVVICRGGKWAAADNLGPCNEPTDRTCPAQIPLEPDGSGAQCLQDVGLVCYQNGLTTDPNTNYICFCNRNDSGVASWECVTPTPKIECPWPRPHLGASCASAGAVCESYACWHDPPTSPLYEGVTLECNGAYWVAQSAGAGACR